MKTVTIALSIVFLSAGAFAGDRHPMVQPLRVENANVTIVAKNQPWPRAGMITVEPCNLARCIDI